MTLPILPARQCIAVAVSGGIDSLCALLLLKRRGLKVFALHGIFLDDAVAPPHLAKLCARLGVDLVVVNLANAFYRLVIEPFANSYAAGRTPNPCVACNRNIKFGLLLNHALSLGANALASGHYVRKCLINGRSLPVMAADMSKDQSYFLAQVDGDSFQRALFPLADLKKSECRAIVADAGLILPTAKESQDICFVDGDWPSYLLKKWPNLDSRAGAGPVVLVDGQGARKIIGEHEGDLWKFTQGQRKGLGLPWREPLYVVDKNMATNTLFVASKAGAQISRVKAGKLNFFLAYDQWPQKVYAKLRYRQQAEQCRASLRGDYLLLEFAQPRWPAASGQLAAIYREDGLLLGGGIIESCHQ